VNFLCINKLLKNNNMKKYIIILLIASCIFLKVNAQNYNTGIGLRLGPFTGLTIKHFISSNTALEGIVDTRWSGYELTGLYEIHKQAFDTQRLKWYYGLGAHIGDWNGDNTNWGYRGRDYTVAGIDGIFGLEYCFREIPFNIGLDWKPALNIVGYSGFWVDGIALSLRYIF
jgi:hypothetical protein